MTSLPTLVVDKKHALEQSVIDKTFREIMKFDPESYERIERDESKKLVLTNYIRQIVKDQEVPDDFDPSKMVNNEQSALVQLGLSNDKTRVESIKGGLAMTTYTVKIDTSKKIVSLTHVGETTPFQTIQLDSRANIDGAYYMQVASIIIEGVLLVMTVIGLKVPISEQITEKASKELTEELATSNAFRRAVEKFLKAWNKSDATRTTKAMALFFLLKDTYALGILWNLIKLLCSEMTWWDWTKAAALITAQLIAAFATDGLALIAKIALALNNAYSFTEKIKNLVTLNEMRGVDIE